MQNKIYTYLVCFCAALVLSFMSGPKAQAQQVGVKTNVLMWAGLTPNASCEVVVGEHSSVDLGVFGHVNPYGMKSKILAFQPEFRYWFNGRPMVREYVGVSSMIVGYNMNINRFVYNGNAASLGLTGGYALLLGTDWRLDLCGGFGLLLFKHKYYYEADDIYVDDDRFDSYGYKLFPAKLGISFTYIIK